MTALTHLLLLNGTDRTSYLVDHVIDESFNITGGNTLMLILRADIDDITTLREGQSIVFSRGTITSTDFYLFRGKILKITRDRFKGVYNIVCRDSLYNLEYDHFTTVYDINISDEAGEISAIWSDIVTGGGYTPVATSSGTGAGSITINRFTVRDQTRGERMRLLRDILLWIERVDYETGNIVLEPRGNTAYSTPLVVGTNILNLPEWNTNAEQMRNRIKVVGAPQTDALTETFSGDSSTTEFTLSLTPSNTEVTVGGVVKTRGVMGQTTSYDYSVDEDYKKIVFVTAPATGTNNISVTYSTPLPVSVEGTNDTSIASTTLEQSAVFTFKDLFNVDDAEKRLQQLLDYIGDALTTTTLFTSEREIKAGMTIEYSNPEDPSFDGTYVVYKVRRTFTDPYDTIYIGDTNFDLQRLYDSINSRLEALEQQNSAATDLLRNVVQSNNTLSGPKQRYSDVWGRDVTTAGYMHWTDAVTTDAAASLFNGTWGSTWAPASYPLASDEEPVDRGFTLLARVQANNMYVEDVRDTDFYDDINSSGVSWGISVGTTTSQTLSAGTVTDDATIGSLSWTNLDNIKVDDANHSYTTSGAGTTYGHYLKASNFGFTIPTGSTINGITVTITKGSSRDDITDGYTQDNEIRLIKANGGLTTTDKADTVTHWTVITNDYVYGSSSDLWGETWTAEDINNHDFGVAISNKVVKNIFNVFSRVYYVDISVNYTTPAHDQEITMVASGVTYTKALWKGTAFSYCTIYVPSSVSDVTIEVSADGKSTWQTITQGTRTALTSSTTAGVYLRFTNTATVSAFPLTFPFSFGTGVVTLENTYGVYGEVDESAIVFILEE